MLRIVHDVPRWHVYLHREARDLPPVQKEDTPTRKLEDELFDRLYSGGSEKVAANDDTEDTELQQWAEKLHALCTELPAFIRLTQECLGDADASATAVEKLMEALAPHLQRPADTVQPPVLRRAVASACEKSSQAIEKDREATEGLSGIGFGTGTSTGGRTQASPARRLSQRLKRDERLSRIAMLAGKFKRIAAAKMKAKVRHGADEVSDVELGSNLSRVLPSELVKLSIRSCARRSSPACWKGKSCSTACRAPTPWAAGPSWCASTSPGAWTAPRTSGPRRWRLRCWT